MLMIALLTARLACAQAPQELPIRRFALIAGANDGGRARVTLRYAGTDARSLAAVIGQIGGVAANDLVLLEEPTPATLARALDELGRRLTLARETSGRLEVIFYFSGHSDENALLLGEERFGYDELRRRLEALPAEVRIAIVDACASGALTRGKGGVARAPFLVDASSQLKGHAFLTSASIDEAAQESERLKASVFTHALVSGLRGGADSSRDGRVTLAEAYQFAFNETLARTASTRSGPQRPAFDIQLVGTGEMVLTDVRVASAQLELSQALTGRVFVLNATGGLVVEVAKASGSALKLGVEPGSYRVLVDEGKPTMGEALVTIAEKQTRTIESGQLAPVTRDVMVTRGGEAQRPYLPIDVAFIYPLSIGGALSAPPRTHFSLGILTAREGAVDGLAVSSLGTWIDGETRGLAAAGVGLRLGGLKGVAVAPVVVTSVGDVRGGVLSTINVVAGSVTGLQAGVVSVTTGGLKGLQASVVGVATGDVVGAQTSVVNVSGGGAFSGAQLGVLNIGGDVSGAQIGVVNIAGNVKGTQIGVLNIAATSTAPIGLVNAITKGAFRASVWAGETNVVNLALKLGSKNVYSYAVAGLNPRAGGVYSLGLGLGLHLDFGRWYGQLESDVSSMYEFSRPLLGDALQVNERLVVGYQVFDVFSVYAGPQFTQIVSFTGADVSGRTSFGLSPSQGVRLAPGLVVGVQLL